MKLDKNLQRKIAKYFSKKKGVGVVYLSSTFSKPRGLPRGLTTLCFFSRELILREKKVLDLFVIFSFSFLIFNSLRC